MVVRIEPFQPINGNKFHWDLWFYWCVYFFDRVFIFAASGDSKAVLLSLEETLYFMKISNLLSFAITDVFREDSAC